VKERGRARRVDEEGEGGEGVAALLGEGRSPRVEWQREGRGGWRVRVRIFVCVHIFFCAFLKN